MRQPSTLSSSKRLIILLGLAAFLWGCPQAVQDEEILEIKNAVRKYNRAIIQTYDTFDMNVLAPTATEKEVRKVDVLVLNLRTQNKKLKADLEKLRFTSAEKITGTSASVKTQEEWRYRHEDIRTGRTVGDEKNASYTLVYTLMKTPEGWKVDSVEAK